MVKFLRYISFFLIMLLSLEVLSTLSACQDQCLILETKSQENCRDCLHVVRTEVLSEEVKLNFISRVIEVDENKQSTMMLNSFSSENFRPPNTFIHS